MDELDERLGVFEVWKRRCAWCGERVMFQNCQKEHLIPLSAADKIAERKKLFGLPEDFKIESFENWVPACSGCNLKKHTLVVDPSPLVAVIFTKARKLAPKARKIAEAADRDSRKGPLLAKFAAAVKVGDVTREEVFALYSGLRLPETSEEEVFHIAPGLDAVEKGGKVVEVRGVSASGHVGTISTKITNG